MGSTRRLAAVACSLAAVVLAGGCVKKWEKTEQSLAQPVNCATAQADLRVLQGEKVHVAQQIAAGATSLSPPSFLLGIIMGTEGTKVDVFTGDYNKKIDERIALIKSTCKIE
jgi:hypothetical protein